MIQHILLVAAREFRQIAMTRSFWVTLLILPLALAVGPLASRFMGDEDTETVMLVDQSGGDAAAEIMRRIELDRQRTALIALSRFVERRELQDVAPGAIWTEKRGWFSDADVMRFVAEGGQKAALERIAEVSAEDAKAFEAPEPAYRIVPTPPDVARAPAQTMDRVLEPYLRPAEGSDRKPVDYVVFLPPEFGASPLVRLWANGQPRTSFVTMLQGVLTARLRTRALETAGVPREAATQINALAPAIAVTTPPEGSGRERVMIRSILPLGMAYLLLMSLVLSGSWMLQSTVEERGNKLLETVLACVTPNELMYGKLVGTVAVGLAMIATWVACGIFAAYATHGAISDIIRPALEPVSTPGSIAAILFFFVAGYVMVSMLFLVIGAMSDSMRDAQGYLTPVILIIMMPFTLLVQGVMRGGSSIGVEVMTWIPLYTPFAVLARLGAGIPAWQILATGAMLVIFVAFEILLLGRVFRASILNGGRKPSLAAVFGMMRKPE